MLARKHKALVFLFAVVCGIMAYTIPAYAAALTAPYTPTGGSYGVVAICNLNFSQPGGDNTTVTYQANCNYSGSVTSMDVAWFCSGGADCPGGDVHTTVLSGGACVGTCTLTTLGAGRLVVSRTISGGATGDSGISASTTLNHGDTLTGNGEFPSNYNVITGGRYMYQTVTYNGSAPVAPSDWFTGGTAILADPPSPTCTRTLGSTSDMAGTFTSTNGTLGSGQTSTQAVFAWGDGSSNTTVTSSQGSAGKYVAQHVFTALSTQPQGGWLPVATVTYSAGSGSSYASGATTTKTCTTRADFNRPNISDPSSAGNLGGSGDNSTTGDSGLDACLPSGWNLLNPLAFVGSLGCILKFLFIPSSTTTDGLSNLWGDLTTKAPFSVIYEAVTFIPGQVNDMITGLGHSPPFANVGLLCGVTLNGGHGFSNVHGANYNVGACDDNAHMMVGGMTYDSGTVDLVWYIHNGALFILGGLFFYACYRGLSEVLK